MKTLVKVLCLTATVSAMGAFGAQVYYTCDFGEGFKNGDLQGQKGWTVRTTDGYCNPDNIALVGEYHGRQCVKIDKAEGWDGVVNKSISGVPKSSLVQVSLKVFWPADSAAESLQISGNWWRRPVILLFKPNDNGIYLNAIQQSADYVPAEFKGVTFNKGEWLDITYSADLKARCCYKLKVGSIETDIMDVPVWEDGDTTVFESVGYVTSGSNCGICVTDIKVETIEREGSPMLALKQSSLLVESKPASASIAMVNMGGGTINYKASAEPEYDWLTIGNPSGSFDDTLNLSLKFNRSIMDTNVYVTLVTVDGGMAGTKQCTVKVRSKGALIAYDFSEPLLHIGEISGQDTWKGIGDDGYVNMDNAFHVTNLAYAVDGPCGLVRNSHGWDGYTCEVGGGTDDLLRVSMKLRKDSESSQDMFSFRNNWWSNLGSIDLWRYEDHFYIYQFEGQKPYTLAGGYEFPLDTWLDFSYTFDMRLYKLVALSLGDFSTNYANGIDLMKKRNEYTKKGTFEKLSIICGNTDVTDAGLAIDDLKIVRLEREKRPIIKMDRVVALDASKNFAEVLVYNAGGRGFTYTLKVLDMPENIIPNPASGKIGASGKLCFDLDASKLSDGFYRSRAVMDWKGASSSGSGAITSVFTLAKGGWYYGTEFEGENYHLGPLNGQDTWEASSEWQDPEVSYKDEVQSAYFPKEGRARTVCFVPAETAFTFKCRFFMEEQEEPAYAIFSQIDDTGYMPLYIVRDPEMGEAQLGYFPAGSETYETLCSAPLGQWNDFSYTMDTDPMVDCMLNIKFGEYETNFADAAFFLNQKYDGCAISNMTITAVNSQEDSETMDVGFRVDNIVVHDNSLPEPAIFGLLALLGAFSLRRR